MSSQTNDCNKSGCCSPLSRREFLQGALGAAVAAAGWSIFGLDSPLHASPDHELTEAELQQWFAALRSAGKRLTYSSRNNPLAAVPLGGIGCGNVYIGSDGTLKDWLIFNNVHPIQIPNTFFAARAGHDHAIALQTSPLEGVDRSGLIRDIELIGEYPYAILSYKDDRLPVSITLEATSPMILLDSLSSAYPAAIFTFKIKNSSAVDQDISLLFASQNSAGVGDFGGNVNTAILADHLVGLSMTIAKGEPADVEPNLRIVSTARSFPMSPQESADKLDYVATNPAGLTKQDVLSSRSKNTVFWLENPGALSSEAAKALLDAIKAGASLVISNASALLNSYAAAKRGEADFSIRPDILIDDFESGNFDKWTAEGEAFSKGPQTGATATQNPVSGFQGKFLINSYLNQDNSTGKLISKPFKIERNHINFLIGGGANPTATAVHLRVSDKIVRTATGENNEHLSPHSWEVSGLQGQTAVIEIVDLSTGPWGHINVDAITQSDFEKAPMHPSVVQTLSQLLPIEFEAVNEGLENANISITLPNMDKTISLTRVDNAVNGNLVGQAETLAFDKNHKPVIISSPCDAGRTVLVLGSLLNIDGGTPAQRIQILKLLAASANAGYVPGSGIQPTEATFGDMAILTDASQATAMPVFESADQLLKLFSKANKLPAARNGETTGASVDGQTFNGALTASVSIPPGEERQVRFYLSWRFPNYFYEGRRLGNHYATRWSSAFAVASDLAKNASRLLKSTERFHKTMYDSTLPYWMIDCLTSQSSTIRSEVCLWTEEDTFAGFEGSGGCCPMNCSHVWGYEQTLSHQFPDLERRMRNADFKHQQNPDGGLHNRIVLPLRPKPTGERPFADGHASGILKAYREHLNSADNAFLKEYYPNIKLAVDYLVNLDGETPDGIIECEQFNTYDCQVSGANSFIGSYYLAALRAGEEMALLTDDKDSAKRWRSVFQSGQRRLVELCWNGEYFFQNLPGYEKLSTQYGPGCLADQLIGQWWAHQLGLGYILPRKLITTALRSIFKYNWLSDFTRWKHHQRVFASGHDKGLLCCSWPKGGRPQHPIFYCDEVWTGVEYQVAAHMLYEGLEREGLAIVAGARERYDGQSRNPWNEIECGGHYARAMSSWALLLATAGFLCDGPKGLISFAPTFKPEKFKSLFTTAKGWGSYTQTIESNSMLASIHLAYGELLLNELRLQLPAGRRLKKGSALLGGASVGSAHAKSGVVTILFPSLLIHEDQTLSVTLTLD